MTKKTATTPEAEVVQAAPEALPPHPLPATGGCFTIVNGVPVRDDETPQTEA